MTSQDDRRTMEAMLASIREAIHRETALQMAGLHRAGKRVVVDHGPVSRPAVPANVEGEEAAPPDYLRPLKETDTDDLMPSSEMSGQEGTELETTVEGMAESDNSAEGKEAQPLRLAAGGESDVVGSVEDLFVADAEKRAPAGDAQARHNEGLFEDILAGRHSVERILKEPGKGMSGDVSGAAKAWHKPARWAEGVSPESESGVRSSSRTGRPEKGSSFSDIGMYDSEASQSEKHDPLNEIDLDDDIIWATAGEEALAHERDEPRASVVSSANADEAVDDKSAAATGVDEAALVAPEVAERVAEAFGRLDAEMMLSALGGSTALERIVRQEMRPLLREWLNAHLPGVVERIIREEIRRIVHGGRTPRSM